MDGERLKKAVRGLRLTDSARARIVGNVRNQMMKESEEKEMEKSRNHFRKTALIAAAAALSLCFTAALAAGVAGHFRDVRTRTGTVTGTAYEQAAEEIGVTAAPCEGGITVRAVFNDPGQFPYRELEKLSVGSGRICGEDGAVIARWTDAGAAEVTDGVAVLTIPAEVTAGQRYTLTVDFFVGESKADAPLEIRGPWECEVT